MIYEMNHIYELQISFHPLFIPHGNIGTHKWPAPNVSGFIAQLVRASHRCHEVTGSKPVEVLNFVRLLYAIAKIAFVTARIIASLDFISAVHIYDPFHISFHRYDNILNEIVITYTRYITLVDGSQTALILELSRHYKLYWFQFPFENTLLFLYYDHVTLNFLHQSSIKNACFLNCIWS